MTATELAAALWVTDWCPATPLNLRSRMAAMQKISTFLTFNDRAEEAVKLHTAVFKNSKIVSATRYGDGGSPTVSE